MSFSLTQKFFSNARGLTFTDSGGIAWSFNKNTNTITVSGSAGGVLSSVGFADTSATAIYTVTNSPLTANGTIDITLKTQNANLVFAGPSSGGAAQPTFRALVLADLPTGLMALADGSTAAIYNISGSPANAGGTLTFTLKTQNANLIFAGPSSGGAAQPTFRAMVVADLPLSIPNANLANSSVTVTAGTGLSGGGSVSLGGAITISLVTPVTAANGGTGQSSYTVGDLLYASASATLSKLSDVAAGSYLRSGGAATAPVWSTITIPNAATLGDIWYSDVANDIAALAGNTTATKKFLTQTGTGSVSAAPAWGTIAAGDLPANGANPTAKVALAAVNGSATTWMRSDAAPALDVTISPTWTGNHTFTPGSGVAITVNGRSNFITTNAAGFATNSAWSAKYTVFGPNAGSTTGAAVAIGYDTTADAGGLICLAPNVGWKNLGLWCNALTVYLAGTATFGVTSNGAGYVTGVGGTITQLTSRTTGVTLNKMCGAITLFAAAGTAAFTTFTVTNSTVAATDTINLSVKSGTNVYLALVTAVAAGSFNITFWTTGGTASDSPIFNFAVIKAVTA